jgi:chemotaxis protein histidine kinase CheA
MDDLIKEFLVESIENLDRLDSELVKLESDPSSEDLLSSIFRTIHTIKGSCGFLGFGKLEKVAHAGESLLSLLRDAKIALTAELTSGLLSMVDAIRTILQEIDASGQDGKEDYPELIESLNQLQHPGQKPETKVPREPKPAGPRKKRQTTHGNEDGLASTPGQSSPTQEKADEIVPARQESVGSAEATGTNHTKHRPDGGRLGGLLVERGLVSADILARALREQAEGDSRQIGEILVSVGSVTREDLEATIRLQGGSRTDC